MDKQWDTWIDSQVNLDIPIITMDTSASSIMLDINESSYTLEIKENNSDPQDNPILSPYIFSSPDV